MTSKKDKEKKKKVPPLLSKGDIVKGKWKIVEIIGKGAFGETYAAVDSKDREVAIKIERTNNKVMVLKTEASALKKLQDNPYVVRCISFGREEDYNFLVMERLQDNLADLRKRSKNGQFTLFTTVKVGIQLIESIEGMHKLGYIHRDVKPHNFVTGRKNKGRVYVIDFGLARKYIGPDGEHRPPRNQPGFKGTARYASLNSHKLTELSRRDDLISIFYMLVEFYKGSLPWAGLGDKPKIAELKEKNTNEELLTDFPKEFITIMNSIMKLSYYDEPEYDLLKSLLKKVAKDNNFNLDDPFDWDRTDNNFSNSNNNQSTTELKKDLKNDEKNDSNNENNSSTKDKPTSSSKVNFGEKKIEIYEEVKRRSFEQKKMDDKDVNSQKLESKVKNKGCCIVQ